MKREVAADIRAIFNAADRDQAETQLRKTIEKHARTASKLTNWLEGNIPEELTIFSFPEEHRRRMRTVNSLERVCEEIRRRTRVAGIFPNEASCLRLVSAQLMEISEIWETGKIYLSFLGFWIAWRKDHLTNFTEKMLHNLHLFETKYFPNVLMTKRFDAGLNHW